MSRSGVEHFCVDSLPGRAFYLGSVTKTVTSAVLAALVVTRRCSLEDDLGQWLDAPAPWSEATIGEVAVHRAGLPRVAPRIEDWPDYLGDAQSAATAADAAIESLHRCTPERRGGFAYSNFGYQLLGVVIERASDDVYLNATRSLLLDSLDVEVSLSTAMNLAAGAVTPGRPILPAAGRLLMTGEAFGRYLAALADPPHNSAGDALRLVAARDPRWRGTTLGWRDRGRVLGHRGRVFGTCAMAVIAPERAEALGVLADDGTLADHIEAVAYRALGQVTSGNEDA